MGTRKKNRPKAPRRSALPLVLIAGGALVLLAVAIFSLSGGKDSGGTPRLVVGEMQSAPQAAIDGMKVDFGNMALGAENAALEIHLTNTGDGLLEFTEAPYVELAAGC